MISALEYFKRPTPRRPCPVHGPSRIPSVGPDPLESRALLLDRFQQYHRAIPILHVSGLYTYAEDKTQRIHQQLALASVYLLPSIVAA